MKLPKDHDDIAEEIRKDVRKALFQMPWVDVQGDPDEFANEVDKLLENKLKELITLAIEHGVELGEWRSRLSQ